MCEPHDESDDLPVKGAVTRVVDPACEDSQERWFPSGLSQKCLNIRVGVRSVFAGLSRDDIDGKERARLDLKLATVGLDEPQYGRLVFAIADACPDYNGVKGLQIALHAVCDFGDSDRVSRAFKCGLKACTYPECLSVRGRIGEERVGHVEKIYPDYCVKPRNSTLSVKRAREASPLIMAIWLAAFFNVPSDINQSW